MITEIPTAEEFREAGLNQIYLAWQIAMQVTQGYDQAQESASYLNDEDATAANQAYWLKSQPVLANALGLVQQSMEMALKGRISAISPYLLIARDPKDWPSKVDTQAVPFSEFRTLDAADLVKVHNTFSQQQLNDEFKSFWDGVRRDRNKLMHSVATKKFDPALLIKIILQAVETLFTDMKWPLRLMQMELEGKYAAYGMLDDHEQNIVMGQIETALEYLDTSEKKRFFSFDSRRRAYVCPLCWRRANRDWQESWPALAQLTSKSPQCNTINCVVCDRVSEIKRIDCTNPECKGNVISEYQCLTCLSDQDSPSNFHSGLELESRGASERYHMHWCRAARTDMLQGHYLNDSSAIEHVRRAMSEPHLISWQYVRITKRAFSTKGLVENVVGTWKREDQKLSWHQNLDLRNY